MCYGGIDCGRPPVCGDDNELMGAGAQNYPRLVKRMREIGAVIARNAQHNGSVVGGAATAATAAPTPPPVGGITGQLESFNVSAKGIARLRGWVFDVERDFPDLSSPISVIVDGIAVVNTTANVCHFSIISGVLNSTTNLMQRLPLISCILIGNC